MLPENNISADQEEIACFICGSSFTLRRVENHIFSCEQKWEVKQMSLPVEE